MRCPTLAELPPPPPNRTGWPWTEETPLLLETMPDGSPWPRISIVTPSYNQAQFLEETIRSILLQNYPDLEYIIIDGGSRDGSVKVIKKYKPWLAYWISEPDRGQSHAINKGFERCTGDLITFQNSDDIYLPETFHDAAVKWCECGEQVGAIIGGFHFMNPDSRLDERYFPPRLAHSGPVDLSLGPPGIYRLHQVSTFFTRQALDDIGRWMREDMKYVLDRELLYRILKKYPARLVDRPYGAFRKHDASKSAYAILPFAQEFSRLYLLQLTGDRQADRMRKNMARYRLLRGYMKYAEAVEGRRSAIVALLRAAVLMPACVFQRPYLRILLKRMMVNGVA